jgi:hypothetical protein
MPFNAAAGHPFSEAGVATYAPCEPGIYGIYSNQQWIYVGESQDIEKSLYAHLHRQSEESYCILSRSPTHFVFDLGDEMWGKTRVKGLVEELKPACNWT